MARAEKMYGVPQAGPWWPAVGAPLERGVRRLCAMPDAGASVRSTLAVIEPCASMARIEGDDMATIIDAAGEKHELLWLIDGSVFDIDDTGRLRPVLKDGSLGNPSGEVIDLERAGWKFADVFAVGV